MPSEIYYKPGFGRRLRKISNAAAALLDKIKSGFYSSLAFEPPTNSVAPVITGSTTIGSTLSLTPGTYTGSPTLTYQWYVNDAEAVGETTTSFDTTGLNDSDVVKAVETATNPGGFVMVSSNEITVTV